MNPDTWKLVASIGGVLLTVVTGPIIWAIRAESGKIRAEMKLAISQLELRLVGEHGEMKTRVQRLEDRAGLIYHP